MAIETIGPTPDTEEEFSIEWVTPIFRQQLIKEDEVDMEFNLIATIWFNNQTFVFLKAYCIHGHRDLLTAILLFVKRYYYITLQAIVSF